MEAAFELRDEPAGPVLALKGDWTVWTVSAVDADLRALALAPGAKVDVSALGRMDVAGAWLVERTLRQGGIGTAQLVGAHPSAARLIAVAHGAEAKPEAAEDPRGPVDKVFEQIGRAVAGLGAETRETLAFFGLTLVTLVRLARHPKRIRWISAFSVMETAGLNALPIIMLLSFAVGVVIAFLGARVLGDFGVSVFTVELVAFSVLREFGVVITCVLLAGRTDSAFTAQIGAMKMRQEIDAMRVLGLDPMEAIVAPRVIAMLVMTPVLTFAAVIAGLFGGLLVCWAMLNVSPVMFFSRINESIPVQHYWVGMAKTPVMAMILALTGCRHGLATGGDVTSLGERVTSSVVQAIFLIILVDALFAVWFLEMDW